MLSKRVADVSYLAAGEPSLPSLIFLHGVGGGAAVWTPQLHSFANDWRTIAWDMPGYGESAPLPDVTFSALADQLARFLDGLGIERTAIVGHSIGGMVLQRFLADHPSRVSSIVLSGTSPAFGRSDGAWQQAFIAKRLGPLDRGAGMGELAPGLVAELVGDAPDSEGLALAETVMAAVPEATYRAMMRALLTFDMRAELSQIAVPCLVLAGEKDANAPAAMMEKMALRIRGARYAVIPRAGHIANLEQPAAFDAAVSDFFSTTVDTETGQTR